jgi:hypothetical protein
MQWHLVADEGKKPRICKAPSYRSICFVGMYVISVRMGKWMDSKLMIKL